MDLLRVLAAYANEPLAIMPDKIAAITGMLLARAVDGQRTPAQIEAAIGKRREAAVAKQEGAIAVIPVHGVLSRKASGGDMSAPPSATYEELALMVRAAMADDEVKAVVLDVASPGGVTTGLTELATELREARGIKPVIAQVTEYAASAAYWIAAQADEIVVTPSGSVGSIGVYTTHEDVSAALDKAGVKVSYISAGKFKVEGNSTEPLGEEARAHIQGRVDKAYDVFVSDVAAGRGITAAKVKKDFGQGRMFDAEEAVEAGLADRVATMEQTLERFGAEVRPANMRQNNEDRSARAAASETLAAKLKAGEPVTEREWENGLKGLVGLSNSEAKRAVSVSLKSQRDSDEETERNRKAVIALKEAMSAFSAP